MAVPRQSSPLPKFAADERQRQAIEHFEGPIIVVAGAGTGKTTVLTRRIAHLISEYRVPPKSILALTYTDNAAREMSDRVKAELSHNSGDSARVQVVTFHAYCNELLIRSGKGFGLLDDKDLWIFLRRRIQELHLKYFLRAADVGQFLKDLLVFMRRCLDELVSPQDYRRYVQRLGNEGQRIQRVSKSKDAAALSKEEVLERCNEIANVYETVEGMLVSENLGTFGHQITRAYELLKADAELLAKERNDARFILVDEFQDANAAQIRILQLLAGSEANVFAVGDPDQAIYRFRGASSSAFELFESEFPGSKLVELEKNRRSTTPILHCAYALIAANPRASHGGINPTLLRSRSPLVSAREELAASRGEAMLSSPVEVAVLAGKEIECFDVVNVLKQKQQRLRCAWSDFAVLYRLQDHRNELVAELIQAAIPFSVDNVNIMDTPESRDLFACLGAIVSTADTASLFRVAALPQFGLEPEQLRSAMKSIPREQQSAGLAPVLPSVAGGAAVLRALQHAREEIDRSSATGRRAVEVIVREFTLDTASRHLQTVLEFVGEWEKKALTKTGQMGELLEYLELFREAGGAICMASPPGNAVRLMTAHTAKGLEFNHVFILRATKPSFPSSYKETLVEFPPELRLGGLTPEKEERDLHEEEERRIFYVAMTRARDTLTIYAKQGTGKADKTPPGFLRELLKDSTLKSWVNQREALPFQTDLFAQAVDVSRSRTGDWLSLPPVGELGGRLSASAIQQYEICPLKFKLEREWNLPSEVSGPLQYGGAMHRVLKTYFDALRYQRRMSKEDFLDLFRLELAGVGMQDAYQRKVYEQQGLDHLSRFVDLHDMAPILDVLHTEEPFEIRVGDILVAGRIDRIDRLPNGLVSITDYKTGKPQSQEDADNSLQLSIYALAAEEKWGYVAARLALYNLQENASVESKRTEAQLLEARHKVIEVAAKIVEGCFEPKKGFQCSWCSYQNLCPATEKPAYVEPAKRKASAGGRRS